VLWGGDFGLHVVIMRDAKEGLSEEGGLDVGRGGSLARGVQKE